MLNQCYYLLGCPLDDIDPGVGSPAHDGHPVLGPPPHQVHALHRLALHHVHPAVSYSGHPGHRRFETKYDIFFYFAIALITLRVSLK